MNAYRLPFRVGNDICRIDRIRRLLVHPTRGGAFIHRILTPREIKNDITASILAPVLQRNTNTDSGLPGGLDVDSVQLKRAVEFMAGRFAAKEAVIKAHPRQSLLFHNIAIVRDMSFHRETLPTLGTEGGGELAFEQIVKEESATQEQIGESAAAQQAEEELTWVEDEEGPGNKQKRSAPLVASIFGLSDRPNFNATVSVSHDTDYATAVCVGVDVPSTRAPFLGHSYKRIDLSDK